MAASLTIPLPQQLVDGVTYHGSDVNAIVTTATVANVGSGNGEIAAAIIQSGQTLGGVVGTAGDGTPALRLADTAANRILAFTFVGAAQANQVFGRFTADVNTTIVACELNAYGGGPTGQNLIAGFNINGALNAQTFALTAGASPPYSRNTCSVVVTSGQTVDFLFTQVGNVLPGTNVQMTLYITP